MKKRKITARVILNDIQAGATDTEIMEKHRLSAQGLQSVFTKMLTAGVVTQAELDERVPPQERTIELGLVVCPTCGHVEALEFEVCPSCGFTPAAFMKKKLVKKGPLPKTEPSPEHAAGPYPP